MEYFSCISENFLFKNAQMELRFLEGVYTWNFIPGWNSFRDEIIPVHGEMSLTVYTFLPRWNFLPGWTHLCQKDKDEISFWDKKKKKKRRVNTSSRYEILKWVRFFIIFDVCSQIFFPKLTCLKIMTVWIQWNTSPLYKKWSPKRKRMRTTSKQSKMLKHFYYFFHFLWEVYKRLKFHFVLIFFLKVTYLVLTARN